MKVGSYFGIGDTVELAECPLEAEGVGPRPGEPGRVEALPQPADALGCLSVHFEHAGPGWRIPPRYLRVRRP